MYNAEIDTGVSLKAGPLRDRFNRKINYLRVSVTDLCNLRCVYCIGPNGVQRRTHDEILSFEEIVRMIRLAVAEGISRVRLTGGEPLVRRGIVDLVRMISAIDGIRDLSLTTNGLLLGRYARKLKDAGLDRVNVSIDSLCAKTFGAITGGGALDKALTGIEAAEAAGLTPMKLNIVLLSGVNVDEVLNFARLTFDHPWTVRFIEYMQTEPVGNVSYYVSTLKARKKIEETFGALVPIEPWHSNGPLRKYRLARASGTIGFISAVSHSFCRWCNRLRLTSQGTLRACLVEGGEVDVRSILRSGGTDENVREAFRTCVSLKPLKHGRITKLKMHEIGG